MGVDAELPVVTFKAGVVLFRPGLGFEVEQLKLLIPAEEKIDFI